MSVLVCVWLAAFAGSAVAATTGSAVAATYTVNDAGDAADPNTGDLVCDVNSGVAGDQCTLRAAIEQANATAGVPDRVEFGFPVGTTAIMPASALPIVTDTLAIDGTTQASSAANTKGIVLDGTNAPPNTIGLRFRASGNAVTGLAIAHFGQAGVSLETGTGSSVKGNYIGLGADGTAAAPNGDAGVAIFTNGNVIGGTTAAERNVIAGNALGISIGGNSNTVTGNYVGTNRSGLFAVPNSQSGLGTGPGATGNVIGGPGSGERNVISGNGGKGIDLQNIGVGGNTVQGNLIGLGADGQTPLGNGGAGVEMLGRANLVGGSAPGAGNVISKNQSGVRVNGLAADPASGNTIQGNFIGTTAPGTSAAGNTQRGVEIDGYSAAGSDSGSANLVTDNVISSNGGEGVLVAYAGAHGNTIDRNKIGTDPSGTVNLGNQGRGVLVSSGANASTIGGTGNGAGNTIAFNGGTLGFTFGFGVVVDGTTKQVNIRQNSIFANANAGIDLGSDGVTPNDPNPDSDTGSNDLQNFPEIVTVQALPSSVRVTGTLKSGASTSYELEFFASSTCDASGHGQGQTFLGQPSAGATVTTDPSGVGSFDVTLPSALPTNQLQVTATASSPDGNTSEFSACATDSTPPSAPVLTGTAPASPASDASPRVRGSSESGSTVRLYTSADCSGSPAATGSAAELGSPGLQVTVPEGTTVFHATATDTAGNQSGCSASSTSYTRESTPPDTEIDSGPPDTSAATTATFAFHGTEGSSFECSVDGAAFAGCGSPFTVGPLSVGQHSFAVRAVDSSGNPDPTPASRSFNVESPPPQGDPPLAQPIEAIWKNSSSLFEVYVTEAHTFAQRGLSSDCPNKPLGFDVSGSGRHYTGAVRAYRPGDCAYLGDAHVDITLSESLDTMTYRQDSPPGSSCCARTLTFERVKPTAGKTVDARLISGTATVKCPGKPQGSLSSGALIKLGCKVDATNGVVAIDSATGTGKVEHSGNFSEGAFVVSQTANPSKFKPVAAAKAKRKPLLTVLSLVGPKPTGCKAKVAVHAARRGKRLRGHTRHAVRTIAQHAAATVHGTIWLMEDRCDGTFVTVSRGVVTVRDFKRKKDVKVTAGHSYLAKAR